MRSEINFLLAGLRRVSVTELINSRKKESGRFVCASLIANLKNFGKSKKYLDGYSFCTSTRNFAAERLFRSMSASRRSLNSQTEILLGNSRNIQRLTLLRKLKSASSLNWLFPTNHQSKGRQFGAAVGWLCQEWNLLFCCWDNPEAHFIRRAFTPSDVSIRQIL